jgi:hypothetical protein
VYTPAVLGNLAVTVVIGDQPAVQDAHVNVGHLDQVAFPLIGEGIGDVEEREIGGDLDVVGGDWSWWGNNRR